MRNTRFDTHISDFMFIITLMITQKDCKVCQTQLMYVTQFTVATCLDLIWSFSSQQYQKRNGIAYDCFRWC